MNIENAVVLVTGANRGLGLEFARQALAAGAKKVYAAARNPASVTLPGVIPVQLDVTNPADALRLAQELPDVTVLVNNAGIAEIGGILQPDAAQMLQRQLEVNVFGPLRLSQAFAPVLKANGGGAIINVLSIASWITGPLLATYAVTKSAAWSMTNALRQELQGQQTQVLGLHVGFIDTDLTKDLQVAKVSAASVVEATYAGLVQDAHQVLADDVTRQVHAALSGYPDIYLLPIAH